ncbi:MAG: SLC13 family permease [Actinobacteria bacterium]|nr:SLC13 family permease [Actinomycetota bacterium]
MSWEAWFTLAVVAVSVVLLSREILIPSVVMFGAAVLLLVAGVLEPEEAFVGFSNPAPITVAALYVLAGAIERSGVLLPLMQSLLGGGRSERRTLGRLLLPAAGSSAFLNNTPIVAMLVPAVSRWSNRTGGSVSALLMPLSFAAILGGMITVIGTSTNIVVSGLLEGAGYEPIGFFEITRLGLPVALAGLTLLLVLSPMLLPNRQAARLDLAGDVREFVLDVRVVKGGPLDGTTVEKAGLRALQGVFLVQIDRESERRIIAPVAPTVGLRGGDRLRFVGRAGDVLDLQSTRGLEPEAAEHLRDLDTSRVRFFEAVVGSASPLVGRSMAEIGFRARYGAAVFAIHRADHRVVGKLGKVRLRVGDTLLLVAEPGFRARWQDRSDFLLVSRLDGTEPVRSEKAPLAVGVAVLVVVAAATGVTDILEASLVGALALLLLGVMSPTEMRGVVDLNVLVVIASSFGVGAAILKTGLADQVADVIIGGLGGLGHWAVLLGVILATVALTETVTNNAAAVLMFPIAVQVAGHVGGDPRGFAMAVAVVASASFLTPIGYQTNTMVWGPGGYRFTDYARLGAPLTAVAVVIALGTTLRFYLI